MPNVIKLGLLYIAAFAVVAPNPAIASTSTAIVATDAGAHSSSASSQDGDKPVDGGRRAVEQALSILQSYHENERHNRPSSSIGGWTTWLLRTVRPRFVASGPPGRDAANDEYNGLDSNDPVAAAVRTLELAAKDNDPDALYTVAETRFYGNYSQRRALSEAFDYYSKLAHITGNSSAQNMVALMHSTGLDDVVPRDPPLALLYYTFAARSGHLKARMATAFRHHSGIGTSRSCETAVGYYKQVADEAIKWYRSGPPGGRAWVRESFNIADEDGGVYGEGASSLVTGHVIRAHSRTDGQATLEDVLEYLDLMSSKGDYKATFSLGRLYYEGQRGLKQDFRAARRYFRHVADQYWRKDGTTQDTSEKPGLEKLASKAAGYLGQMFLRGDGVDTDYATALDWFRRGEKKGDATCQNGLGLLHLYGFGVRRDPVRAVEHFRAASEQDYAAAQVNLGALYLDQGQQADIHVAARYFELAARHNHIEALYYLGEMHHHGLGRAPSCGLAVAYYKMVSERVEPLVSSLTEAHEAYASGDVELALLDFIMAAEQGFEKAQANVAYLLDSQKSMLKWPSLTSLKRRRQSDVFRDKSLALVYWTRAAKQKNMDAMVKMGDYYLNGIGTPRDESKAASCYTAASEVSQSSQALYNLGWMHENGIGLTQDFHLAKRFYDHALESNPNAFLPVTLSLAKLRLRSAWNTLTRGRINSIQDEPVHEGQWSLSEWLNNLLQDDNYYYSEEDGGDDYYGEEGGSILSEDDPTVDYDNVIDDGVLESFAIVVLAAAFIWLIVYRQQRQQAHQQNVAAVQNGGAEGDRNANANAQQGAGQANGLFPAVGDPAFADWVAGGIGH